MRGVKALFTRLRRRVCSAPSVPSMLGGGISGKSSPAAPAICATRNTLEKVASSRRISWQSAWRNTENTRSGSPSWKNTGNSLRPRAYSA